MESGDDAAAIVLLVTSVLASLCNWTSVLCKVGKDYINPKLWKYSLLFQNIALSLTSVGLLLFCVQLNIPNEELCKATGFFLIYGITESLLSFQNTCIILLFIQNPGKPDSISNYHRNIYVAVIIPEVVFGALLSVLPYVSRNVVDTSAPLDVHCLPIVDYEKDGSAYGTLVVCVWWIALFVTLVCDVIVALKAWKFNNRIDLSPNNVWQTQLIAHGKALTTFETLTHIIFLITLLLISISVYSDASFISHNSTWIVMLSVAAATLLHGLLSNVSDVMWSTCCCRAKNAVQEPHRKLKKLQLVEIEAAGRLRMKATWSVGKHVNKRGLMKVYGADHLRSWAQEIVMLGMMRKTQHPSLVQCLWTNSSNPYYETMTLISGEIITSDSRIICLELTNGGTLKDFLQKAELPLPEPCQRMIIHDIAEGLFYLHHENILHNNLSSSCIYLKGSLQSMVLRAAIGDFEEAELYGTLQLSNSLWDKRYFFFPDIRSFALVAIEIVSKMCVKKFQNRFVKHSLDQVPTKQNLENIISDGEDEFEAQYCYDIKETHRPFESVIPEYDMFDDNGFHEFQNRAGQGSLDNLIDKGRPLSPDYRGVSGQETGLSDRPYCLQVSSDNEDDRELTILNAKSEASAHMENPQADKPTCKSPVSNSSIVSARKSRRDMSKSLDRMVSPPRVKSPVSRSLSSKALVHRCISPDPMTDEKLHELRNETETEKQCKKEKFFSFNRKRSDEKLNSSHKNGQRFEAFVNKEEEKASKKKDGKWLSKPTSILKTIAGNESTVTVFKAKLADNDNCLDAIEEEEIDSKHVSRARISKSKERKEKTKSEVWDIIDEQYYTQVNKKAMNKLKKTVSGESRSSLWSFISTPEDLDEDDLDDILESLPGMTDTFELRNGKITASDILAERESASKKDDEKKFSYKDLSKSRFELIDYYELLKSKQITIKDVPEDKREILLNVVELKLEEKLRKEGKWPRKMTTVSEEGAIRSDEMYDNGMNPMGTGSSLSGNKVKMVSFRRQSHCHSSPYKAPVQSEIDPKNDCVRSAPLKRARTPLQKTKTENAFFSETKSHFSGVVKRSRARTALKRALNSKGQTVFRNDRVRILTSDKQDLTLKYATVRKINVDNVPSVADKLSKLDSNELITVPVPTSESFSVTKLKAAPKAEDVRVKRYPSFSSNESGSSFTPSVRIPKPADGSLTSGELSSLSSQAESDHYETDGHMTDIEGPSRSDSGIQYKKHRKVPGSRVDSGFESGSVSSEVSEAMFNRGRFNSAKNQNSTKGSVLNTWARNNMMVESIPSSPYNFSCKFLPPVFSLPEELVSGDGSLPSKDADKYTLGDFSPDKDTDSAVSVSSSNVSSKRMIEVSESKNRGTFNLLSRTKSSEKIYSQIKHGLQSSTKQNMASKRRPMSPLVRPSDRPVSPLSKSMSPTTKQLSPPNKQPSGLISPTSSQTFFVEKAGSTNERPFQSSRPVSPPVESNESNLKSTQPLPNPLTPLARPVSLKTDQMPLHTRTLSPPVRSMSPQARPLSPITYTSSGGNAKFKVSPSRALSPIERVESQTLRKKEEGFYSQNSSEQRQAPIIKVESFSAKAGKYVQDRSNQASRRYRELVKQGVPLRASVIDLSPTRHNDGECERPTSRPGTAESTLEDSLDDQRLFEDLESKGFFALQSTLPDRKGTISNKSPQTRKAGSNSNTPGGCKRKKHREIPLEEIVRENPSSGRRQAHRSPSKNHLIVSDDAFLNQPTSEDSETCSIKTNKSTNSSPSGSTPKVVVDAELVIDRIFSLNNPQDFNLDVEVESALGLDNNPLKQLKKMYNASNSKHSDISNLESIPLLSGVSQRHIHECMKLASCLNVITVRDLLPATKEGYDGLRNKLVQIGQLGSIGLQLLDIIEKCWLSEMPPASGNLVEQLTDPVTETEL